MSSKSVVVIDAVDSRRAAIYRCLAATTTTIPVATLGELGSAWPQSAWFLVADEIGVLEALQAEFAARGVAHPVVSYSETLEPARMVRAIYGGAVSYVVWPCDAETIHAAMDDVAELAAQRCEHAVARMASHRKIAQLTARELEVVQALRAGRTSKEIGRDLGISHRTVEVHRANAMARLGTANVAALVTLLVEAEAGPLSLGAG